MSEAEGFLAKAQESLASAEDDHAKQRYNACARNVYYAAFQAAIVALLLEDIRPRQRWEHEFVRSEFGGRLVYRRKMYDAAFRTLLTRAFDRRVQGDYTRSTLKRRDVSGLVTEATLLLRLVKERHDNR